MGKKKSKSGDNALARNKKAFHDYTILEKIEAGLELRGTEVKSCRAGSISIADAYVKIENGEAKLHNLNIAVYDHGNRFNHDPQRVRRLLMHKREILRLASKTQERGCTIVPLRFYLARGRVKVELGLAKGKTHQDRRDTLRRKQDERDTQRAIAHHTR